MNRLKMALLVSLLTMAGIHNSNMNAAATRESTSDERALASILNISIEELRQRLAEETATHGAESSRAARHEILARAPVKRQVGSIAFAVRTNGEIRKGIFVEKNEFGFYTVNINGINEDFSPYDIRERPSSLYAITSGFIKFVGKKYSNIHQHHIDLSLEDEINHMTLQEIKDFIKNDLTDYGFKVSDDLIISALQPGLTIKNITTKAELEDEINKGTTVFIVTDAQWQTDAEIAKALEMSVAELRALRAAEMAAQPAPAPAQSSDLSGRLLVPGVRVELDNGSFATVVRDRGAQVLVRLDGTRKHIEVAKSSLTLAE